MAWKMPGYAAAGPLILNNRERHRTKSMMLHMQDRDRRSLSTWAPTWASTFRGEKEMEALVSQTQFLIFTLRHEWRSVLERFRGADAFTRATAWKISFAVDVHVDTNRQHETSAIGKKDLEAIQYQCLFALRPLPDSACSVYQTRQAVRLQELTYPYQVSQHSGKCPLTS